MIFQELIALPLVRHPVLGILMVPQVETELLVVARRHLSLRQGPATLILLTKVTVVNVAVASTPIQIQM